jgi:antitoxin component YwqK of YwqJK toxin-antitoxin module
MTHVSCSPRKVEYHNYNGKRHRVEWTSDRQVKKLQVFKNGLAHGEDIEYWEIDNKQSPVPVEFSNNTKSPLFRARYISRKSLTSRPTLKHFRNFQEGELMGQQLHWYPSGSRHIEENVNDICHQIEVLFESGYKKLDYHYLRNNKRQSTSKKKLVKSSSIQDFNSFPLTSLRRHGDQYDWYATGVMRMHSNYHNGVMHNSQTAWFPDGLVYYHSNYHHGNLHGKQLSWFYNGQPMHNYNFVYGKKEGLQYEWFFHGGLKSVIEYKNNILVSYCFWYPNGTMINNKNISL